MKNLQIKKLHTPGMILFYVFQVSLYSTFKNSKHGLQKCWTKHKIKRQGQTTHSWQKLTI